MVEKTPEQNNEVQPLTDSSKEQIKLRANFLNGLAVATFAVGTLAPLTRALIDNDISTGAVASLIVLAIICLTISGVLHSHAYRYLKELDK